jgi:small-conductance mechanosensitive channel
MVTLFNINIDDLVTKVFTKWILALIIILIGLILGKLVHKILNKVLRKLELNKLISKTTGLNSTMEESISVFVEYFIYFITFIIALDQLNITTTILNFISGAVIAFILISSLIAIKDFFPNFIAGIYIINKSGIKVGDFIGLNSIKGKIKEITLIETRVETKEKEIVYIPNSNFLKHKWKKLNSLK